MCKHCGKSHAKCTKHYLILRLLSCLLVYRELMVHELWSAKYHHQSMYGDMTQDNVDNTMTLNYAKLICKTCRVQ